MASLKRRNVDLFDSMRSAAHININERKPEKVMEGKARETTENRAFLMTSVTFNYSKQRLMDLGGGFFWLLRDAAGCCGMLDGDS